MSTFFERLKEERKRLGLNQTDFAGIGSVTKETQIKYENGTRKPDSEYLEAIFLAGVDVVYVLTGSRASNALTSEETELLSAFRALDERGKAGVFSLMQGISPAKNAHQNVFKGDVGQILQGDLSTNSLTFNVGKNKKK